MYIYIYIHIYIYTCIVCVYIYIYVVVYMYTCIIHYMSCIYIYIYIYIYICIHTCICTYIYIYRERERERYESAVAWLGKAEVREDVSRETSPCYDWHRLGTTHPGEGAREAGGQGEWGRRGGRLRVAFVMFEENQRSSMVLSKNSAYNLHAHRIKRVRLQLSEPSRWSSRRPTAASSASTSRPPELILAIAIINSCYYSNSYYQ